MLINQDFAQSEPKSPAKRSLVLVTNANPTTEETRQTFDLNPATKLLQETIAKIDGAYAPSTIRAYRVDYQDLIKFCIDRNMQALPAPPQLIAEYIRQLTDSGRSSASIRRAIAGIATIHKLNRFTDPTKDPDVVLEMRRMHRQLGRASHQAQAVTENILDKLLDVTEDNARGARDRALLLTAYDTMCRRSELAALQIEDLQSNFVDGVERMTILIRRSKTDQESYGQRLHISDKTNKALKDWIARLETKHGQLFRGVNRAQNICLTLGASQINRIYKQLAKSAGLNKGLAHGISGHSMRVGRAQDLAKSGASMPMIMCKGRWSKIETVMRYIEHLSSES